MKQNDCRRENDPNFNFKPLKSSAHLATTGLLNTVGSYRMAYQRTGQKKVILLLCGWALLNNSLLVTLRLDVVKSFVMISNQKLKS